MRSPPDPEGLTISDLRTPVHSATARPGLTTWVDVRVSCSDNVRTDEVILRRGVPAVRVAVLTDATVSYGVGVHEDAPYLAAAQKAGLATVRRTTGGTGLVHGPGDLAWSIVLPRTDPRVGRDYVHAYSRLGAGVVRFLSERAIASKWVDPPGTDSGYCLLSARGSVLSSHDKILGGAAQHLAGGALLHHGILPFELNRPRLHKVFGLSDASLHRLTSLRELGIDGPSEPLAWKLAGNLSDALSHG